MEKPNPNRKGENLLLNLAFNLIIPIVLLKNGGDWLTNLLDAEPKEPELAVAVLIVALVFPLGYGINDFIVRRRYNPVSLLGFVNVLLTGGIGLLGLSAHIYAIKEAALPAIIAVILIVYRNSKNSLTHTFLYNPDVIRTDLVETALEERGNHKSFNGLLTQSSWWLAASFLLSSVLNYVLSRHYVKTDPSDDLHKFENQVADMWIWSFVVIALPCMIITGFVLWRLFRGIRELTGLEPEDIMIANRRKE